MTPEQMRQAMLQLVKSPAAAWIGNRQVGDTLQQVCTRCGASQIFKLPTAVVQAFAAGDRGNDLAASVPDGTDEALFEWKIAFQKEHEGCSQVTDGARLKT